MAHKTQQFPGKRAIIRGNPPAVMIEKAQKHRILSNFTKNRPFNLEPGTSLQIPPLPVGRLQWLLEWERLKSCADSICPGLGYKYATCSGIFI